MFFVPMFFVAKNDRYPDFLPALNYLSRADWPEFGALGPLSKLRLFSQSVGQN
jgi:hypothetical protein